MTHHHATLHHHPATEPGAQARLHVGHSPSPAGNGEAGAHPQHDLSEHALDGRGPAGADVVGAHAALGHTAGQPTQAHGGIENGARGAEGEHAGHAAAHADHTGHEQMFRWRFWLSLLLSIPVLLYSTTLQSLLHFSMPAFPGTPVGDWIEPVFSVVVFVYGGVPFLQMALPELQNRRPGMMSLISLAISVASIYSLAALLLPGQMGFFWELVTLIDIMLLGHWIEMHSVRQASGALNELARLMPDTAERLGPDGAVATVPVSRLRAGDLVLVRPCASIPADGGSIIRRLGSVGIRKCHPCPIGSKPSHVMTCLVLLASLTVLL